MPQGETGRLKFRYRIQTCLRHEAEIGTAGSVSLEGVAGPFLNIVDNGRVGSTSRNFGAERLSNFASRKFMNARKSLNNSARSPVRGETDSEGPQDGFSMSYLTEDTGTRNNLCTLIINTRNSVISTVTNVRDNPRTPHYLIWGRGRYGCWSFRTKARHF